jgi:hypothetical protein
MANIKELSVIQKMTDYIDWVSPLINRFPRDKKFTIGERLLNKLYNVLELLIKSKFSGKNDKKKEYLHQANIDLEIIRILQRFLIKQEIWSINRHKYAIKNINEIGKEIGSWYQMVTK